MPNLSKTLRRNLKPACLTATLVTCWQVGQVALAQPTGPNLGDPITIQFDGTVSPSTASLSHMYLVYGTGSSGEMLFPLNVVSLGDFGAGQGTPFSVTGEAYYADFVWWYVAALYGDASSGQYLEGVNGVTLSIWAPEGDSWDSLVSIPEATAFNYIWNGAPQNLPPWNGIYDWNLREFGNDGNHALATLSDFSNAAPNGEIRFDFQMVPEPAGLLWLGTGAAALAALRRRNGCAGYSDEARK